MIDETMLKGALEEIDKIIDDGKHPENYASMYTSEDAGKTHGLMIARRIIKDAIGL